MQTILVFSHLRWNFVYQRPQHLLGRLARRHRILFLEEPVRNDGPPTLECIEVMPQVQVLRPHTPLAVTGFHAQQLTLLKGLLNDQLAVLGVTDYAVWFYTPMAWPLIEALHPSLVIYDCMDELSAFLGAPPELRELEAALLGRADVVLTGGPGLYAAKRHRNPNVLCLPSSVDADHFAATPDDGREGPGDRAPRLGFFGVIDERMDTELLGRLAGLEPDWQLFMIGPVVKIDPQTLPQAANIHWLGQREYADLPQLIAGWDICLMPFAINEATRFISPTKTLEYMAAGKPVVSTAIRDVATLYGDVVEIADDADGFLEACRRLLAETPAQRLRRANAMAMAVARSSWDHTVQIIEAEFDTLLQCAARAGKEISDEAQITALAEVSR
jgi:glycosyltransferase involved in cell wall biosynthesis